MYSRAFTYRQPNGREPGLSLTAYHNLPQTQDPRTHGLVVYWHGGGLVCGNNTSYFPHWLCTRVVNAGLVFISADYRLIPPCSGHEILQDVKDLFTFIKSDLNALFEQTSMPRVNLDAIAVAGTSAGGMCAYLAAAHADPRPKALLSMYGMGGDLLTPHYLSLKTKPFYQGRDILDPTNFSQFLHPESDNLPITSDSPLEYAAADAPIPGYPISSRMLIMRLYLQLGITLDYYTGQHGISAALRGKKCTRDDIPKEHHPIFPQFNVSSDWPPCFLVHGALDSVLSVEESRSLSESLRQVRVPVTLIVVKGKEHSFDYVPDAEKEFGEDIFNPVLAFLQRHLQ